MLTPITFVTKDHRVTGDYQIETDNEGYIPPVKRPPHKSKGIHPMTPPTPPTPISLPVFEESVRTPTPEPPTPEPPTPEVEPIPETTESDPTPSDYSEIATKLDNEMRALVGNYESYKAKKDTRTDVMMKRIRLKHPIFHLLTITAFKFLMDNGFLFKPKTNQNVYKEDQPAKAKLYFPMYGKFDFTSSKLEDGEGSFGEKVGLGWTIGEEILYNEEQDK
jgi:hypothetical protein